jgi:peptide chain release factor subunit 1
LKKLIRELGAIRGRHTELVSVYIPAGHNLTEVMNQLFQEKGTASNIKSKATRKNVLTALEKIIQHLKLFRKTPENGLVVFCGNVSAVEGKEDIKLWSYEPPVKMQQKVYWCDQEFVLKPLRELIAEKEVYGLIVLDAREANIGLLKGKMIESLKHLDSTVPSKTVKGGMSQHRFDRIREDVINEFLTEVGEAANQVLLEQPDMKGLIIGGPGNIKETFFKEDYLHYKLKQMVLGMKDTGYTGEFGLKELVERSTDLLKQAAIVKERELMERFFTELKKEGAVVYGFEQTNRALDLGAVETLLVSEGFNWVHVKLKCQCGFETEKDLPKNLADRQLCGKCGKTLAVEEEKDLADAVTEKATNLGAKIEFVSTDTGEGQQFKGLGGVGAFLRYKLD